MDRYIRQLAIPEIRAEGQRKLANSSALVVGAGGLGSALLYCLCGAGVGRIGIVDDDVVTESNLNRQFLHTTAEIGRQKIQSAAEKLNAFNPEVILEPCQVRLTEKNADALVEGYDIVLPSVDNMGTRLAVNLACCKLGIPLVNGGVNGMLGSLHLTMPGKTPCIACIYGDNLAIRESRSVPSFAPVVSVISSLMAQCAMLLLLGLPDPLGDEMLWFDGRSLEFNRIRIHRTPHCPVCGNLNII